MSIQCLKTMICATYLQVWLGGFLNSWYSQRSELSIPCLFSLSGLLLQVYRQIIVNTLWPKAGYLFLRRMFTLSLQLAGVQPRTVRNNADGTLDLDDLQRKIRARDDPHMPWTRAVCLENTQNRCGGSVISVDYIKQVLIVVHLTASCMCTWYWSQFIWPPHACAHSTYHGSCDHLMLVHMVLITVHVTTSCLHGTDHGSSDHLMLAYMLSAF